MISITNIIDDKKVFEEIRILRWPSGVCCPKCGCTHIKKNGSHTNQVHRKQYICLNDKCGRHFNDLTDTIFENHHIELKKWVLCSYFMGLNLSNKQIGEELDLNKDTVQMMCTYLRENIVKKKS